MSVILRLLRPHQYIKNGFVVLGVVFGQSPTLLDALHAALAFVAFCLAASSVYVFNDMVDVESDRMHPIKRNRPIASGAVSLPLARGLSALLAALALGAAFSLGWLAALFIALYLVLNVAYSLRLKHVVILDVFLISAGFMLRILIGTAGIGIPPSQWLLLTGLMLTLFLGFAKRRAELIQLQGSGKADRATVRRVLENYSPAMLDQLTGITAACFSAARARRGPVRARGSRPRSAAPGRRATAAPTARSRPSAPTVRHRLRARPARPARRSCW